MKRDDARKLSQINAARERVQALYAQGRYQEALDACLQITRDHPDNVQAWLNAARIGLRIRHEFHFHPGNAQERISAETNSLNRLRDAIHYAQTALACGSDTLDPYAILANAHGQLRQKDEARRYGCQALNMQDRRFGGKPVIPPPEPGPMPPPPSARTRERNVIAFSLFGGNSKYCESAVLNVQEQPLIYPHWVCRFYVDGSVPAGVIDRLRAGGAQIVTVDGSAALWPGQMWRFLALDDPQAHRVLFRDADSVISRREAGAVGQWVASSKRFHIMRDWGSHLELILAGMWGAVAGSLPPLEQLMQRFMNAPLESRHFADQFFLRQYVWPYARTSLMQHDSMFGFMDGVPFPDGDRPDDDHVGCSVGPVTAKIDLPEGSEVTWALYRIEKRDDGHSREALICSYTSTVKKGNVEVHIPKRYKDWLNQKTAELRFSRSGDVIAVKTDLPDESQVTWHLYRIEKQDGGQAREELVCSCPATVKEGGFKAHLPAGYAQRLKEGTAALRFSNIPRDQRTPVMLPP